MIACLKTSIKLDRLPESSFFDVGIIFADRDFDDISKDLKNYIRTYITPIEPSFVDNLKFVGLYNFNFMIKTNTGEKNFRRELINSSDVIKLQSITSEITNHITKKFLNKIQSILPGESIISVKEFMKYLIKSQDKHNLWLEYRDIDENGDDFIFMFPHFDNFQLK